MISEIVEVLVEAGWKEVPSKKHFKYRCPCGEHQVSFPKTPSDVRSEMNTWAVIWRLGCPTMQKPKDERTVCPDGVALVCFICRADLKPSGYRKDWVSIDGKSMCRSHHGVQKLCREGRGK